MLYFKLQSPVLINSDSIDLTTNICTIMVYYEKTFKIKMCRVGLELPDHMLLRFNGCRHLYLLLMDCEFHRLVKINSVLLKDTAFISSNSLFQSMPTLLSYQRTKNADGQINRWLFSDI